MRASCEQGRLPRTWGQSTSLPTGGRRFGTLVSRAATQTDGRVIVVDASGSPIADSQGPATGVNYATSQRPEVRAALKDVPTSVIRFSQDLGVDIMATAVPIVDESSGTVATVVGAVRITRAHGPGERRRAAGQARWDRIGVEACSPA